MNIGGICNRNPVIIGKSDSVYHAAELMRDKQVNFLIVVESHQGENVPLGIVTERDIVVDAIANRRDLGDVTIGDVMRPNLMVAHEDDQIVQTVKRMRNNGVCCLPVINDNGILTGILSIVDILDNQAEVLNDVGYILSQQLHTLANERLTVRQN